MMGWVVDADEVSGRVSDDGSGHICWEAGEAL
jgi:hypothetical protein